MLVVAAIDIGTNSVRMLLGEKNGQQFTPTFKGLRTTRIGEGFVKTKVLQEIPMQRTIDAVVTYYHQAQQVGAEKTFIFATSAVRDALNKNDFVARIKAKLDCNPEILSGEQEAQLSFEGAAAALNEHDRRNLVVIDIGGGSTEIVFQKTRVVGQSVPVGAVKLRENQLTCEELSQLFQPVIEHVPYKTPHLVAVGGTATSLAAIAQELVVYEPRKIHGFHLTTVKVAEIARLLDSLSLDERRNLPGLDPQRADIIPYGTAILLLLLRLFKADEIIVSESDILEGRIMKG